ncbi:MSC_0624 family F1-like ATPase-associated membrane protein [Mycoplasma procyoni]|uniref:MSC_0624 family F1-like ATPase-associated membrane protein n=1 Tax=Mycoplasma procyoni TaxID=568784 RepID=UPI00197C8353|nr:hypothetical protein [Mycoplasma procyoni]MBN3534741.1 hypothetical protein [Mycoplasma procyoni]
MNVFSTKQTNLSKNQKANTLLINSNTLFFILKYILIFLLVVGSLFIFTFYQRTILGSVNTAALLFDFNDANRRQLNFLVLLRVSILSFVFIYSIFKNYINLILNKELISKYWYFYIAYVLFTLASFILFFAFTIYTGNQQEFLVQYNFPDPNLVYSVFGLSFIFLPLVLLNAGYHTFIYLEQRKTNPLLKLNLISLIASAVAQLLLFITGILLFYFFIEKDQNTYRVLDKSTLYKFFDQIFEVKQATNIVTIIFGTLGLTILVLLANAHKILVLLSKYYSTLFFKNLILLYFILLSTALLWFIIVMSLEQGIKNAIDAPQTVAVLAVSLAVVISLLITTAFVLSQFLRQIQIKGSLYNTMFFGATQSLIWLIAFILFGFSSSKETNIVMIFFSSLFSIITTVSFAIKQKNITFYSMFFSLMIVGSNILLLFATGFNQILLSQQNYYLSAINEHFSTIDLFVLFAIIASVMIMLSTFADLLFSIFKNYKYNQKAKQTQNPKGKA